MKRKFAWLALPLLLCALVWGVKWRADHPTPTKLDLEVRALMLKSSKTRIIYFPSPYKNNRVFKAYGLELSRQDLTALADCLLLLNQPTDANKSVYGESGSINISSSLGRPTKIVSVSVTVDIDNREGRVVIENPDTKDEFVLHPSTTKRWLELLLNHPTIGPELRRRINQ